MFRFLSLIAATLTSFAAMTMSAHACEAGDGKELCKTKNGHYRILLPKKAGPHPTVMHLYGSTGQTSISTSERSLLRLFLAQGYAVIVPAALDVFYNDPKFNSKGEDSGWHLRNERRRGKRDEIAFLTEVLNDATVRHGIDRNRVLLTGQSRGASLAWEIACHAPQLAGAYAPHAGLYFGQMPKSCRGPVRILHTHGRADDIVPLGRSERTRFNTPVRESLDKIGAVAGCTHPGTKKGFKDYERTTWWGCQPGSSVELMLHKGGHNPPVSWYPTVIDWFEQGGPVVAGGITGGTARFTASGEGGLSGRTKSVNPEGSGLSGSKSAPEGGTLLRGGSARSNSRFKKPKVSQ
ncbi:MAG: PHB depolymerase family esterase [Pseudomonadota bacterium]